MLDGPLGVQPLAHRQGRVSFLYLTPHGSPSRESPILWASTAAFRPGASPLAVPSAWLDRSDERDRPRGPGHTKASATPTGPLPASVTYRLDNEINLFVEGVEQAATTVSRCAVMMTRLRLLEQRDDRIRVVLRLVDGYHGRPGPVLLLGWIDLAARRLNPRSPHLSTLACARTGYSLAWGAAYAAGDHVTTKPLPLYDSPTPDRPPVGTLQSNAQVTVDASTLVGAPHRFLKVERGASFSVPYVPTLLRRTPRKIAVGDHVASQGPHPAPRDR